MKWSEQTWQAALPVFEKITKHPFITGLMDGSLEKEKFIFYIRQDALYLAEFGRVLAGIASKLENTAYRNAFLHFAGDTISVENALHETFIREAGINDEITASPSCRLYTSYMHQQLAITPVEVTIASVLPCFWIYKEVGDYILAHQQKDNNPYQSWINTYGGEEYARAVEKAIAICDEMASGCTGEQGKKMTEAFILCSKMEWMFWDSAWQLEQWPV